MMNKKEDELMTGNDLDSSRKKLKYKQEGHQTFSCEE